jgi:putative hydrolase of the HAD superfamily
LPADWNIRTANRSFDILLFDLGGVLIDFAGFEELPRLLPDRPGRAEIRRRWINCEPVRPFERGEITPDLSVLDRVESARGEFP